MTQVDTHCLQDGDFETIHLTSHWGPFDGRLQLFSG